MDRTGSIDTRHASLLLHMGRTGCIRPWRTARHVLRLPYRHCTARRLWHPLLTADLVQRVRADGQTLGWHYKQGRTRRLLALAPAGQQWYRERTGTEPQAPELAWVLAHHTSMRHALGILEARDQLRALDIPVDDRPLPCPRQAQDPFGPRSEPDLVICWQERIFPVEVQRAVGVRYLAKWSKSLELFQRLLLITFTAASRRRQAQLLDQAQQQAQLPPGLILMTSLEELEQGQHPFPAR